MTSHQSYKFPWREDNHFEILIDSAAFFPRMLNAIDAARQTVLLEMYLVESGTVTDGTAREIRRTKTLMIVSCQNPSC